MADDRPSDALEAREPTAEDLRNLCRELNDRGAKYVVVGGFAVRAATYARSTMDIDLVVAADLENEARVFAALSTLPDQAAPAPAWRAPALQRDPGSRRIRGRSDADSWVSRARAPSGRGAVGS